MRHMIQQSKSSVTRLFFTIFHYQSRFLPPHCGRQRLHKSQNIHIVVHRTLVDSCTGTALSQQSVATHSEHYCHRVDVR